MDCRVFILLLFSCLHSYYFLIVTYLRLTSLIGFRRSPYHGCDAADRTYRTRALYFVESYSNHPVYFIPTQGNKTNTPQCGNRNPFIYLLSRLIGHGRACSITENSSTFSRHTGLISFKVAYAVEQTENQIARSIQLVDYTS